MALVHAERRDGYFDFFDFVTCCPLNQFDRVTSERLNLQAFEPNRFNILLDM